MEKDQSRDDGRDSRPCMGHRVHIGVKTEVARRRVGLRMLQSSLFDQLPDDLKEPFDISNNAQCQGPRTDRSGFKNPTADSAFIHISLLL